MNWLAERREIKLQIEGHTDADGAATANLRLSTLRAEAIKAWLVGKKIDAARLTTKGYGASRPKDTNSTPEGRAINRRVEFLLR